MPLPPLLLPGKCMFQIMRMREFGTKTKNHQILLYIFIREISHSPSPIYR